mmetsp:Transcript_19007/g.31813  ORF Transcript_19007/g.31813 Transcript_19007/m.31813 type:complete len:304 (-) Transcript_19007:623-1534(-)
MHRHRLQLLIKYFLPPALLVALQPPFILAIFRGRGLQRNIIRKILRRDGNLKVGRKVVMQPRSIIRDIAINFVAPVNLIIIDVFVLNPQVHLELSASDAVHSRFKPTGGHLPGLAQVLALAPLLGDHPELPGAEGFVPTHALHALTHGLDDFELVAGLVSRERNVVVDVLPVDLVLQLLLDLIKMTIHLVVHLPYSNRRHLHNGPIGTPHSLLCRHILESDRVSNRLNDRFVEACIYKMLHVTQDGAISFDRYTELVTHFGHFLFVLFLLVSTRKTLPPTLRFGRIILAAEVTGIFIRGIDRV